MLSRRLTRRNAVRGGYAAGLLTGTGLAWACLALRDGDGQDAVVAALVWTLVGAVDYLWLARRARREDL